MTISAKVLNDNIVKISDSNDLLDMLIEFERVLDGLDLYAFKNWAKGEVLEGPTQSRHYITVKLMYPYNEMPDPSGAKRLLARECLVKFTKDSLITPKKIRSFDDVELKTRPDGSTTHKAKTDTSPVWIVEIQMPRRFVDEFDKDIIELEDDTYVDMEDVNNSDVQIETEVDAVDNTTDPLSGAPI